LAKSAKSKPIEAVSENAYGGEYPLARFLYIYVNYKPNSQLDPLRREFIKYVFSKQGQQDVIKDGYIPITSRVAGKALTAVGIEENAASGSAANSK
jgi:phosphate transport system substrate-binding protein